ncbi:MAG: penicillin acylase family protein [Gemmatimonadetes bacterium]|nr:penicillin acylase family protein [Gemmatimonadota bacterium]
MRYTAYGMPHVRASTLAGAGEGYGWAFARENLCLTMEKIVTLAGDRSRYIGPDSGYVDDFVGVRLTNVESDAVYRYLLDAEAVAAVRRAASADVRALLRGYVAGFNRHVRGTPMPNEWCRDRSWFRPVTEDDIWRRVTQVPLIMTSMLLLREIASAAPPGARVGNVSSPLRHDIFLALAQRGGPTGGSNALGAGRALLGPNGGGFTFSNPHFPWRGTERLYAMHLTVPGRLDLFGSTLYGVPVPMIGFSESIGWSDTHTTDKRSTIYELTLDPSDPTRYRVGDSTVAMRAVTVRIPTSSDVRTHTIWETRYGPIIVTPNLPWTRERAYAFADPERGNVRMADTFLAIARAKSVHGIRDALFKYHGSPWSNITGRRPARRGLLRQHLRRRLRHRRAAGPLHRAQRRAAVRGPGRRHRARRIGPAVRLDPRSPRPAAGDHPRTAAPVDHSPGRDAQLQRLPLVLDAISRGSARGIPQGHRSRAHGARRAFAGGGAVRTGVHPAVRGTAHPGRVGAALL